MLLEEIAGSAAGRERIIRLRSVMPDESTIGLDEHAAVIALDVERVTASEEHAQLVRAHVERARERVDLTEAYIAHARAVLRELRGGRGAVKRRST